MQKCDGPWPKAITPNWSYFLLEPRVVKHATAWFTKSVMWCCLILPPLLSSPGLSFICLHHLCANLLCERVTGWHRQVIIISSSNTTEQQTSLFQHKVRLKVKFIKFEIVSFTLVLHYRISTILFWYCFDNDYFKFLLSIQVKFSLYMIYISLSLFSPNYLGYSRYQVIRCLILVDCFCFCRRYGSTIVSCCFIYLY